jgi:TPR repeat protein
MSYLRPLIAALFLAAGPVLAVPLEDGEAAYSRKDYATALRLFRPLAQDGNAKAQRNLGLMYEIGRGVPKDYQQAIVWYRKAADQGDAFAQFNLGLMYHNGDGVPRDYQQAMVWYRKAADQGDTDAQVNLGVMYGKGQGGHKDVQQAYFWFLLASVGDNAGAVKARDLTEKILTPQQQAAAQADARNWKPAKR